MTQVLSVHKLRLEGLMRTLRALRQELPDDQLAAQLCDPSIKILEGILGVRPQEQASEPMTTGRLVRILCSLPPEAVDLEVIVSSQGETVQVPLNAQIEAVCEEDDDGNAKSIVRLYTDNGEDA